MNAGASPAGKDFAIRNCDFIFTPLRTLEQGASDVADIRVRAREAKRNVGVYSSTYIVCRPTKAEAEAYHHYYAQEKADWEAVDRLTSMYGSGSHWNTAEEQQAFRIRFAGGHGGYPIIGDPDHVANELAKVAACGYTGLVFSFVDYLGELPYFAHEVLPRLERLGLREPAASLGRKAQASKNE
jgi:alkanesulfonate monooxygenase SsuD/methylene tetrahydromethanopterin reductase-like flavin-dependent oxidoreductase (luciferase family)